MDETRVDMTGNGSARGRERVDVLPPRWVDVADRVDDCVERVKPKMLQLDRLHAKHVLPGFKDRSEEEREIESLATAITRDFRTAQNYIRQIAEMSASILRESNAPTKEGRSQKSAESRRLDLIMAANVQTALATKVQELSGVFRKKQTEYLRRLKDNEGRGQEHLSSTNKDALASLFEDEQFSQSVQSQQTQSLLALPPELAQRDAEISSIAQSITDLADLFKDLSSLVIDQGTLLDRVDYNVEQLGVEVKGAAEELTIATSYQRRSGKCQLIFLLLLLVAGAFLILLYRPRSHSSTPPPPPQINNEAFSDVGEPMAGMLVKRLIGEGVGRRDGIRFVGRRGVAQLGEESTGGPKERRRWAKEMGRL